MSIINRQLYKSVRGQSLVELLVAVSLIIIATLGILALVTRSIGLNRVNADHYTATYLAAEGIELVKNFFDESYLSAAPSDSYGWDPNGINGIQPGVYEADFDGTKLSCIDLCGSGFTPTQAAVEDYFKNSNKPSFLTFSPQSGYFDYNVDGDDVTTKFKRIIVIDNPYEPGSNYEYRVTSAVWWVSRGGTFTVQLQDHFLPWRIP